MLVWLKGHIQGLPMGSSHAKIRGCKCCLIRGARLSMRRNLPTRQAASDMLSIPRFHIMDALLLSVLAHFTIMEVSGYAKLGRPQIVQEHIQVNQRVIRNIMSMTEKCGPSAKLKIKGNGRQKIHGRRHTLLRCGRMVPNDRLHRRVPNDRLYGRVPNDHLHRRVPNDCLHDRVPNDRLHRRVPNDRLHR